MTDRRFLIDSGVAVANSMRLLDLDVEVQGWLTTPGNNHGLMLAANTVNNTTAVQFDSKESTTTSHPAQLQIVLHGPTGPSGPSGPEGATGAPKEELRKKAEGILARVRAREDFATLAKESSEDPGSAPKGGDLGTFGRGQMVPPFEQAAFALKPGEVSGVVETPFGFHIIKVTERIPARKLAFPEVKERLKQEMVQQKRQRAQQSYLNSLRAKAKIETFL
jgi:hypothetical protein